MIWHVAEKTTPGLTYICKDDQLLLLNLQRTVRVTPHSLVVHKCIWVSVITASALMAAVASGLFAFIRLFCSLAPV